MEAERDFDPVYSGKHDNSILGVANKDYTAASVANTVITRMVARDVIKADQVVSLYKSETFPTTGYGTAHNLTPELTEKIRDAFFSFEWAGTSLETEFGKGGETQFINMNYKDFCNVIRKIDTANDVSYACE